jgi:hypothetical protein
VGAQAGKEGVELTLHAGITKALHQLKFRGLAVGLRTALPNNVQTGNFGQLALNKRSGRLSLTAYDAQKPGP